MTLLSSADEERLLAHVRKGMQKSHPAAFALMQQPLDAPKPTPRVDAERLRSETREMKPMLSASRALSDVEQQNESEWLTRAKVGRDKAQQLGTTQTVEALAAVLPAEHRVKVWAAFAAGFDYAAPAAVDRTDLWAPFPLAFAELDGRLLPVLAEQSSTPAGRVVRVQVGAVEESRTVPADKVHTLKRESSEWRPYQDGLFGCSVRYGKPEKSVVVTYDSATGAFGVKLAGEVKPDARRAPRADPTLPLERLAQQTRALCKEEDKAALSKLLFDAESGFERIALMRALCIAGEGHEAVVAATAVTTLLRALSLAKKTPRRSWLGMAAMNALLPASALGAYEHMWGHANPLFALELLAGGPVLAQATHDALAQSTSVLRLLNRELSHRVSRSVVRYVELTPAVAPLAATVALHVAAQWPEGVLLRSQARELVVTDTLPCDPSEVQSLTVRAQAVLEETDEARSKLEMNLRHTLSSAEHKHGAHIGFVTPGQAKSSAGVFIEDAEQWLAEKVDVRGKDVRYTLKRGDVSKQLSAAELIADHAGKRLQWIEVVPKPTKR